MTRVLDERPMSEADWAEAERLTDRLVGLCDECLETGMHPYHVFVGLLFALVSVIQADDPRNTAHLATLTKETMDDLFGQAKGAQ